MSSKSCSALLVRKIFVCRPIDTPDLEVDTRKSEFWCVEIEIWRVDRADTAEIVCVPDTPCPAKDCIFRCVAIFRRNYFSCGHGVFTLRLILVGRMVSSDPMPMSAVPAGEPLFVRFSMCLFNIFNDLGCCDVILHVNYAYAMTSETQK